MYLGTSRSWSCKERCFLFFLGLIVSVGPGFSAEIVVDSLSDDRVIDGNCELAEAFDAATTNSLVDGCLAGVEEGVDVIRIAVGGSIALQQSILSESSVRVVGLGRFQTMIDCRNVDDSCVTFTFGVTSLESLTMLAESAAPLEVLPFMTTNLTRVTLQGGVAVHVWPEASLTLERSLVTGFDTNSEAPSVITRGGAILNEGALVVRDSTFVGNLVQSRDDNRAVGCCCSRGGGDREAFGGAIYSSGGTVMIERSTFSNNAAEADLAYGGALAFEGTVVNIKHSTLAGNWVDSSGVESRAAEEPTFGGGIFLGAASSLSVANSILGGNTAFRPMSSNVESELFVDRAATVVSGGYNFVRSNRDCNVDFPAGVPNAFGDLVGDVSDPLPLDLAPLGHYGGDLPTLLPTLLESSLIVDRGSCPLEVADQRGFANPQTDLRATDSEAHVDDGDGCDIGAVEALAVDRSHLFSDGFESGGVGSWSL